MFIPNESLQFYLGDGRLISVLFWGRREGKERGIKTDET
jgi:hypothetical protein